MSLKMSRTRRQKRVNAEVVSCTNLSRKSPQSPVIRNALKDLQPSSDSPKVLVGSSRTVGVRKTSSKVKNTRKTVSKQSSIVKEFPGDFVDKENGSVMKRKIPSNSKRTASKKSSSTSSNSEQPLKKSNASKQLKISEFTKNPVAENVEGKLEEKQDEFAVLRSDCPQIPIIYKSHHNKERDCESRAEKLKTKLRMALKENEQLHYELLAMKEENTNLKETLDQVVYLRGLLDNYEEQRMASKDFSR